MMQMKRKTQTIRDRMFMNDILNQQIANKNYEEEEVEEKLQKLMNFIDNFTDNENSKFEKLKADLTSICDFEHNYTFMNVLRNKMNNIIFDLLEKLVHKTMNIIIFQMNSQMRPKISQESNDAKFEEDSVNLLLKTLKIIFLIQPKLTHRLNDLNLLFSQVFWIFKQDTTSVKRQKLCIDLMELFIEGTNFYYSLLNVKDISEFIESADYSQMANFTKVLSLFVLDVKKGKNPFKKQASKYEDNVIISNHQTLLAIDNFTVKTIDICLYLTRIIVNISNCQTKAQLQETLSNLEQSNAIRFSNFDATELYKICQKSEEEVQQLLNLNYLLDICLKSSNLTEILFLLSNILQGKKKKDIQNKLNDFGFIEQVFNPLFLAFFKNLNGQPNPSQNGSDILQTSRIQLLRSFMNYCDSDDQTKQIKNRMISYEERDLAKTTLFPQLIKDYDQEKDLTEQISNINWQNIVNLNYQKNLFSDVKNKGTINLLISTYYELEKSNNATTRFWIASCIETFLRGSNQYHQLIVLFYGLQHFITDRMFQKYQDSLNKTTQEVRRKDPEEQIIMDLMGELTKYNLVNIKYFYQYLQNKGREQGFIDILKANIINSNVFLRSLWLTQNKLQTYGLNILIERYFTYQKLNEFLVEWVYLIMKTMCNQQLSQDNICCMNTLILIYLFAWNNNETQETLIINKIKELLGTSGEMKEKINDCFEQWEHYYYYRGKDSFGLSYSTKVPFFYYQTSKRRMCDLLDLHHEIYSIDDNELECSTTQLSSLDLEKQKRRKVFSIKK